LGSWGIRELTLGANKLDQVLKYRKASFPKSVPATFAAHKRNWKQIKEHYIMHLSKSRRLTEFSHFNQRLKGLTDHHSLVCKVEPVEIHQSKPKHLPHEILGTK